MERSPVYIFPFYGLSNVYFLCKQVCKHKIEKYHQHLAYSLKGTWLVGTHAHLDKIAACPDIPLLLALSNKVICRIAPISAASSRLSLYSLFTFNKAGTRSVNKTIEYKEHTWIKQKNSYG